ncbi:unnamed protein product [Sphagnum compactum]
MELVLVQLPLNISIVHAHAFSNQYWKPLIHESYQRFQKMFTKFSLKNLVGLAMGTVVFRSWAREAARMDGHRKRNTFITEARLCFQFASIVDYSIEVCGAATDLQEHIIIGNRNSGLESKMFKGLQAQRDGN